MSVSASGKPGVDVFFISEMPNLTKYSNTPQHQYKYFGPAFARTSRMGPTRQRGLVLPARRLVLVGVAGVTCRALKTRPGAAAVPAGRSHGRASSAGRALSAPTSPWPGCCGRPALPVWLCHPRSMLMDSLTCCLFWGARASRIITSQHSLPQRTLSEQRYVFVVVANWHPV